VVSTANNYLFSPATNLVNDIFVRYVRPEGSNSEVLLVSRAMVVLLGAWALIQSIAVTSVLEKSLQAYTIYSAGLTPVILAAFFWKRATAWGAVASIAAGTVVTLAWDRLGPLLPPAIGQQDAILPALLASLVGLLVVSLLSPRPTQEQLAQFQA
jgi:SSS family solute:Na+ symporter/sodium/proline symporter